MKKILIGLCLILLIAAGNFWYNQRSRVLGDSTNISSITTFWPNQCIDTMKHSRDAARQFLADQVQAQSFITNEVEVVKNLGANCVAIDTPYDEEFSPVLRMWVDSAHLAGLNVWLRGNFSGWEGWFDYPKFTSEEQHHIALQKFLVNHSELFREGDIITPAPEAENGIIGNPWESQDRQVRLRNFLVKSYQVCNKTLADVGKSKVSCGYFSANGDVAEKILDPITIAQTGGVVVIDHYISSIERMNNDIERLGAVQKAKVAIGEFGAPIPDINGDMTQQQQADFVRGLLNSFYVHKSNISLINYWVLRSGTTALLNDDGSRRLVAEAIADYYQPGLLYGRVVNSLGDPVAGAIITTSDRAQTLYADSNGWFSIVLPAGQAELKISAPDYNELAFSKNIDRNSQINSDIQLIPTNPSWWYRQKMRIKQVF